MSDLLAALLLLLGSLFIFIGALGILKFPHALMRAHALSKAMLLGVSSVLLSQIPSLGTSAESIKIVLAIAFLLLTIPISGHIFAYYCSMENSKK